MNLSETLKDRGDKYGPFVGHAKVTQDLKRVIAHALDDRKKALAYDQQEALDMIVHKIGRIINGDASYADSWVDIAGYAKLVADRLEAGARPSPSPSPPCSAASRSASATWADTARASTPDDRSPCRSRRPTCA